MEKKDLLQKENASKGNSEDSLLVIYILQILKKYSSHQNPLSTQDVMNHLREDYSIGDLDKADAQRKKVRRLLDTLYESYWDGCIKKEEGKARNGHKWYYDAALDKLSNEKGAVYETLSKEEIDFIVDIVASSKIINSKSTTDIIKKLLTKGKHSTAEKREKLRKIENEEWPKSINQELLLTRQAIQSCINEIRKVRFDYEDKKSISVTPYGWDSDENGKCVLIAKADGSCDGEFGSFLLDKIQNVEKAEAVDYDDFDDSYFDRAYDDPDDSSMESLFANIQIITAAIEEKNGIEFKYLSYVIKDERVVVDGKDKRVLPHRLVFINGKYYLIGYDEEQAKIDYYRVDLISKLSISDTKIKISDWDARVLSGVQSAREVEKHPLMLAGQETLIIFKVAESALDRVIDAFAVKPDKFIVTKETRSIKDSAKEGFRKERVVSVQVKTTVEEAFRWALANADVVELVSPQEIRDRIARLGEPIYRTYTHSLPDKVRENFDYVLKEGTFKISYKVDEDTARQTHEELSKQGKLAVVDNVGIAGEEICEVGDYFGDFFNAERLCVSAANLKNIPWASRLVNLKQLELIGVQIEDISWMNELKKLKQIHLPECSVSDLGLLRNHTEIDWLDISDTNISDLSFIENYEKLVFLNIVACPIEDYSPLLTTKSNLKTLEIDARALEKIGEDNIRARHPGITILSRPDSPFWRFLT